MALAFAVDLLIETVSSLMDQAQLCSAVEVLVSTVAVSSARDLLRLACVSVAFRDALLNEHVVAWWFRCVRFGAEEADENEACVGPVSYTHLTLPTILLV